MPHVNNERREGLFRQLSENIRIVSSVAADADIQNDWISEAICIRNKCSRIFLG